MPKRREDGTGWNVYKNGGRIDVGLDAVSWAAEAEHRGAGEILLTPVWTVTARRQDMTMS